MNHLDREGKMNMVDVSSKEKTVRKAIASAQLLLKACHLSALELNPKGDVLAASRLAGIQAAKKCWELIPLCHQVALKNVSIEFQLTSNSIIITAEAVAEDVTGVEMEGYCAVAVAGLTLIDMLKGVDPDLILTEIKLLKKLGGKTDFDRTK